MRKVKNFDSKKVFSEWENKLKSSSESAQECLKEILEIIDNYEPVAFKSKIALKVIVLVSALIADGVDYYDAFCKIINSLEPYVWEEWDRFIPRLHYVFASCVIKEKYKEASILIQSVKIKDSDDEATIKSYFRLHKDCYPALVFHLQMSENNINICFTNTVAILNLAARKNQEIFIEYMNQILEPTNWFFKIIIKYPDNAKHFFNGCFSILSTVKDLKDLEGFYSTLTKILHAILSLEINHDRMFDTSLPYLKACMAIDDIKNNSYYNYVLSLYYYLIKVCLVTKSKEFHKNLKDILSKFLPIVNTNNKSTLWFKDTVVTLPEIIMLLSNKLVNNMESETLKLAFDILMQLFKDISAVGYQKTYCMCCTSIKRHQILNIARSFLIFYQKSLDLNNPDVNVGVHKVVSYTIAVLRDFKCKLANVLSLNLFQICVKCFEKIDNPEQAANAIENLNEMRKLALNTEFNFQLRLLKLYKNLYLKASNFKMSLQAWIFCIVNLLNNEKYLKEIAMQEISHCTRMYEDAGYDYSMSLCDILDKQELGFEVPMYNRKLLLRLQLQVVILNVPDDKSKEIFAENALRKADSLVEFAMLVQKMGAIVTPTLSQQIEQSISKLLLQLKNTAIDKRNTYLSLGFLYKRMTIFKIEKVKKTFGKTIFSESTINSMDYNQFKNISIITENSIIEAATRSIDYFSKYFDSIEKVEDDIKNCLDDAIDDCAYIARHLKARGYYDYSYEAWELVYKVASKINSGLNKIRAISYFCEQYYILKETVTGLNIKKEIDATIPDLMENIKKLKSLTPRQQNYVLIGFLNLAYFYINDGDRDGAILLINIVQVKLKELNRDGYELVVANLHAVNFNVMTKCEQYLNASPFSYAELIMSELRNIKYLTSEDWLNVPMLLFEIISEIAQFLINRLCASAVKPHLYMLMKFAADHGFTFRMTQIINHLAHIDLQAEMIDNCRKKLFILDVMLNNEMATDSKIETSQIKNPIRCTSPILSPTFTTFIEPSREACNNREFNKRIIIPVSISKDSVNRFLISHTSSCSCDYCKNKALKMALFSEGCLYARSIYVSGAFEDSLPFFTGALDWLHNQPDKYLRYLFRNEILWMIIHYINVLRRLEKFDRALDMCNKGKEIYKKYSFCLDYDYFLNIIEQESSINYILATTGKILSPIASRTVVKKYPFTPLNISQNHKKEAQLILTPEIVVEEWKQPKENIKKISKQTLKKREESPENSEPDENGNIKNDSKSKLTTKISSKSSKVEAKEQKTEVNSVSRKQPATTKRIPAIKTTTLNNNITENIRTTRSRKQLN